MFELVNTSIKPRFKQLRGMLGKTISQMSNDISIDNSAISKIESLKESEAHRLPTAKIKHSLERLYNVNLAWLETGEGPVVLEDKPKRIKMSGVQLKDYIPVYDIQFTAGFQPSFIDDNNSIAILGYINFLELRGAEYIVQAEGESMSTLINDRDFVGIRPVKNTNIIDLGKPYGIVTEDYTFFKRIRKGSTSS